MAVKQYKNRKDIPNKYKWDLEDMLKGKDIRDLVKEFETLFKKLIEVKESKFATKESFLASLKLEDKLLGMQLIIENYMMNKSSENVVDSEINSLSEEIEFIAHQLAEQMGPEEPRIFANESKIKKYLKEPEFEPYRSSYKKFWETKKHQLPKAIQEFRIGESRADINVEEVFNILTDSEIEFGYATSSKGKKIKVTHANKLSLSKNKDKMVRKTAEDSYEKGYLKHKESLSNILFQTFKNTAVWAKLEKFDSVIDMLVFADKSSDKLLLSLYEAVKSHKDLPSEYAKLWRKAYEIRYKEKPTRYDAFMPLVKVKGEWTIEEMQQIILEAFKPYGKEYTDVVKKAFNENWIDYQPVANKHSGAYACGGTYSFDKKYILMNNDGSFESIETLAHELGHAMHSYFSDKHNHIREASHSAFVAEIASIFNELMLFDHVLKTSDNDKFKFQIRQQMAEGFKSPVFRQVRFSNYEYNLYKAIEQGKPMSTYKQLAELYYETSKDYFVKPSKYKEDNQLEAVIVPHYYYGFYVYKYAIGQLVANIFFERYKKHGQVALQEYVDKFLKEGSRMDPLEILKANGIDLEDPKTYEEGFAPAYENIKELKKLASKIFKIK